MARSRARQPLRTRALAIALAPYVAAQLCVLGFVLAFPGALWREAPAPARDVPVSQEDARDMLERQLRGEEGK
jgi:hypothetical protein